MKAATLLRTALAIASAACLVLWLGSTHKRADDDDDDISMPTYDARGVCLINGTIACAPLTGDIVFTTYLTRDQSYTPPAPRDSYAYMQIWAESVVRQGMHGVVLYDELSPTFVAMFSSLQVTFRRVDASFGSDRTPNDRRFFVYERILAHERGIRFAFLADVRDVKFQKNVFEYARSVHPPDARPLLFTGAEHLSIGNNTYLTMLRKKMCVDWSDEHALSHRLYNAGFMGATRATLLIVVRAICDELRSMPPAGNCNMLAYNMALLATPLLHELDVVYGPPLINHLFIMNDTETLAAVHIHYLKTPNNWQALWL